MSKSEREGKIFIDYLRNHRTATSVAAFSLRARAGAPVSLPVGWEELDEKSRPSFTVLTALKRMREPDPWADYFRCRQRLPI